MKTRYLWYALALQAVLAMLGSLYFSNFGDPLAGLFAGEGFDPCDLCRWGRILMYPLVPISLYAIFAKENKIWFLTAGASFLGMLLAGYHYLIQHQNSLNLFSCGNGNDCALMGWYIGFVTIPFLELIAFIVIFSLSIAILFKKDR